MSTDPREFEHPIDGTGGTVTPLVDVIAATLVAHLPSMMCAEGDGFYVECRCGAIGHIESVAANDWEPANQWSAAHQACAVLDALEGAGHVEWGTGEGVKLMTWRDRGQAERQSASATRSTDGGKTWQHTNPPVVARIVGPWTAVE